MISNKRAKEVKAVVTEVGVASASAMLNISEESVRRYLNVAESGGAQGSQRGEVGVGLGEGEKVASAGSHQPQAHKEVVGVVGDLHAPFELDGYFDHCIETFKAHKVTKVIFIGDVIDNHFSSYHETDPDGLGGGRELELAINRLERWHTAFPNSDVIIGNHDRMVARKAHSSGIPSAWMRSYSDVLNTPTWNFTERVVVDGVQYIHGEGGTARTKLNKDLISTVQGHLHTQCYVDWTVGASYKIFGCQVGCGIDHRAYAMSYAKNFPKPAIACAVIDRGNQCTNVLMNLGGK